MAKTDIHGKMTLVQAESYWAKPGPSEHFVQVYRDEQEFLDSLEAFAACGLQAGEAVVLIATDSHRESLFARLAARGIDVEAGVESDQLICLEAEETLAKFLIENWPDETLFRQTVMEILIRARRGGRKVRAFGEMVVLLWMRGHYKATIQLEHLWHRLCHEEQFPLLCAYPAAVLSNETRDSFAHVCGAHSQIIPLPLPQRLAC